VIDVTEILTHPRVHPGCHATVEGGLYSAPWRLIGSHVDARATSKLVELFVDGELVKTHVRTRKGGKQTDWGDYPPEKVAVKGVLAAGLERVPLPQLTLTSPSATAMPALLRGPDALVGHLPAGHLPAGDPARIATATATSSALPWAKTRTPVGFTILATTPASSLGKLTTPTSTSIVNFVMTGAAKTARRARTSRGWRDGGPWRTDRPCR